MVLKYRNIFRNYGLRCQTCWNNFCRYTCWPRQPYYELLPTCSRLANIFMFLKVLSCDDEKVICEVALSMQRLVKKYGMKQYDAAWESILDIASALQEYVEVGFRTVVHYGMNCLVRL